MSSRKSHHEKLFSEYSKNQEKMFGAQTKLRQLTVLFAGCAVLYIILKVKQWRAQVPRNDHLIVDAVVVEIVEDDYAGAWAGPAGTLLIVLGVAMALVKLGFTATPAPMAAPRRQLQPAVDVLKHADKTERESILSLRKSDSTLAQPVTSASHLPSLAGGVGFQASPSLPIIGPPSNTSAALTGLRVQFADNTDRSGGPRQQPVVETELAKLGVTSLDRAIAGVKEWISVTCRSVVDDIAAVNHWFVERHRANFDCSHTLQELVPNSLAVAPQAPAGFGVMPAAQPAQPQFVTKAKELGNWRLAMLAQRFAGDEYDVAQQVELRLQLELLLDPSGTFLTSARPPPAELQERQQYVVQRLRTFASQRSLSSFRNDRGDAATWREGYPTDSQLLVHMLKLRFKPLEERIRLPHQPASSRSHDDLAIMLGSSGEPYFYVKYSLGSRTQTFQTRPGQDSLFEAFVFLIALVKHHHGGCFGNIDALDLNSLGLGRIIK